MMRSALLVAVLLMSGLVATPAHSSTAGGVPVSRTGAVIARSPVPLVSPIDLPLSGPVATEVFWTRWTSRLVHGSTAVLEGQVLIEDGSLPDASVDLYARRPGSSVWALVGSTVASSSTGLFAFTGQRPAAGTDYRAVYTGTLVYSASESAKRVSVARRVRDAVRRSRDGSIRLTGSVAPRHAGGRILLQRKICGSCRWSVVSSGRTTSRSTWRFALPPPRRGTWQYRAVVPADALFVTSYGDHVWHLTRR